MTKRQKLYVGAPPRMFRAVLTLARSAVAEPQKYRVEMTIDLEVVMRRLAAHAACNKNGRAAALSGAITVKVRQVRDRHPSLT